MMGFGSLLLIAAATVGQVGPVVQRPFDPRCPNGQCPNLPTMQSPWTAGPFVAPPPPRPAIEWRADSAQPNVRYLYVGGKQVGAYNRDADIWQEFDGSKWKEATTLFGGHRTYTRPQNVPALELVPTPADALIPAPKR